MKDREFVLDALYKEIESGYDERVKRFFKVGVGEYAEHDVFIGVKMKGIRHVAKSYGEVEFEVIEELLQSEIHEARMCALLILVKRFEKGDAEMKKRCFDFYLAHVSGVNNWDLVDTSAHKVVGAWVFDHPDDMYLVYDLVMSDVLWERRIAMVSMWWFIRHDQFEAPLRIAEKLIVDEHDLMHKAVGWMLREVGKKDEDLLMYFLKKHHENMPRVTLRYACERLSDNIFNYE